MWARPKEGDSIAVWFSCGAASAVAAKCAVKVWGDRCNIRVVNNPVLEEHFDNRRFLRDVERWIGVKIELATNTKFPDNSCETVWHRRKFMSGPRGAPCTYELKKAARMQWEANNNVDHHVLGFTSEEANRAENFALNEGRSLLPILVQAGVTKSKCYQIIKNAGIELPKIYKLGFPNANCIGCVKASSPTYWNHVRKTFPDVFEARVKQSDELGSKLVIVKGKRIPLKDLSEDAMGRPMKSMDFECGIFCNSK